MPIAYTTRLGCKPRISRAAAELPSHWTSGLSKLGKQQHPIPDGLTIGALQVNASLGHVMKICERGKTLHTCVFELSPSACVAMVRMSALLSYPVKKSHVAVRGSPGEHIWCSVLQEVEGSRV